MTEPGYSAAARAAVTTDRPERYGKQLVSHLGRRHGGDWDSDNGTGWIDLDSGQAIVTAAEGTLLLRVTASGDEELTRLQDVVEAHLVRFGEREQLAVSWERDDKT
ncbi:DUF2218 domain-containing protein [Mycobacterium sp. 1423905.2]|uniref:DUF2218 domain-containing protein n=1 Tax=Mycobacterium sp. 1423905.2 TaxID=1856859 RepID=UPI0007FBA840|nr:DUF2218 domain-containing protein [Mycobacterium sp. 1423905.2]OBJ49256.1 hypothetical protein A9W95_02395 [Mycobacterium sp. 1423905.2]